MRRPCWEIQYGQDIESVRGGHVGQGILKPKMIITAVIIVGTLRCESGDTSENVTGKLTSCRIIPTRSVF